MTADGGSGAAAGPLEAVTVEALVGRLGDEERVVRVAASATLTEHGGGAVPSLQQALSHEDSTVRLWSVITLAKIHRGSSAAPPDSDLLLAIIQRVEIGRAHV